MVFWGLATPHGLFRQRGPFYHAYCLLFENPSDRAGCLGTNSRLMPAGIASALPCLYFILEKLRNDALFWGGVV
jgi:hypothetical protein